MISRLMRSVWRERRSGSSEFTTATLARPARLSRGESCCGAETSPAGAGPGPAGAGTPRAPGAAISSKWPAPAPAGLGSPSTTTDRCPSREKLAACLKVRLSRLIADGVIETTTLT
ncbi:MAG: hypothetical protein FJW90_06165 [Actinobacteria bacterium]|nr:hypothetical protein [Actinomycetota bacterium]